MNMESRRGVPGDEAPIEHAPAQMVRLLFMDLFMASVLQQFLAYLVVVILCLAERTTSFVLERYPYRYPVRRRQVLARTGLYAFSTALRFLVMLAVMSFSPGIFVAVVASMSVGQMGIEVMRANRVDDVDGGLTPLTSSADYRKVSRGLHASHDDGC